MRPDACDIECNTLYHTHLSHSLALYTGLSVRKALQNDTVSADRADFPILEASHCSSGMGSRDPQDLLHPDVLPECMLVPVSPINLCGSPLEVVSTYKYLGLLTYIVRLAYLGQSILILFVVRPGNLLDCCTVDTTDYKQMKSLYSNYTFH